MRTISAAVSVVVGLALASTAAAQEVEIPIGSPGDKGKYYLLGSKESGHMARVLHKRVGVDSVGFSITEINCDTMKVRDIGYSEESPDRIKERPTKWYGLIPGSIKSNLAVLVCSALLAK